MKMTMQYKNLWDTVLRSRIQSSIRKEERSKISNGTFHLRKLEKKEQIKSKAKEKKNRAKFSETENKKLIEKNQQNQRL